MSLTTHVEHRWICNGCQKTEVERTQVARQDAPPRPQWRLLGWLHLHHEGMDYCPECRLKIVWPGGCER
jgi:hypothetical protein